MADARERRRGRRKVLEGLVVSDALEKTVVVAVETMKPHPLFGKMVKRTKKFMAHDERNEAHVGDRVRLMETRPLSKRKRWRVTAILQRAK